MAQFEGVDFPGWEVVRKIGEGSFGGVYEIHRTLPGGRVEKCALKKLAVPRNDGEIQELISQSFSTESITAHYKNQMGELVNEYSLTQELSSCKNVVGCYDVRFIQHGDGIGWDIYIRMELLNPLRQALSAEYQEATVLRLGLDMCNALLACQEHSIIHRDIKPENILVSDRGEFKLGDFGIAKVSERTGTGTMTGTMGYMAPEVANRQHYGPQADIYSLGMVLYWMMNRRTLPFLPYPPAIPSAIQRQEAANRRLAGEAFPPPAHGSAELKAIVMKACAYSPAERCQSAQELRQALAACAQPPLIHPQEPTILDIPDEPTQYGTVGTVGNTLAKIGPVVPSEPRPPVAPPKGEKAPEKRAPQKKQGTAKKKAPRKWLLPIACILLICGIFGVKQAAEASRTSKYRSAQQMMDRGLYFLAEGAFEALGDYSDSAEKAQEAGRLLEQSRKEQSYQDAQALMDGRDYSAAAEAFEALGDYADSASKVQEAHRLQAMEADYQAAQALMDDGKYMQAMWAFKALDYLDSQEKTQEARDCFVASQRASLALGSDHAVGLRSDGTVVTTNPFEDYSGTTVAVNRWTDIVAVSAGWDYTVGLRSDGTVLTAGGNGWDGTGIHSWTDIVAVCMGLAHTVGLRSDGTVVAEGWNVNGELEIDDWTDIVAISAGEHHTVGLRSDGTVVATGWNGQGPSDVSGWTDIVAISARSHRTVGLKADGTVVVKDLNSDGWCEEVRNWSDIAAVSAGNTHIVGLRSDGTVVAVGNNEYGQCDVGSWTDIVAVTAGNGCTMGLRSDGTVVAVGQNDYGQCDVSGWTNIATGPRNIAA